MYNLYIAFSQRTICTYYVQFVIAYRQCTICNVQFAHMYNLYIAYGQLGNARCTL